MSNEMRAGSAGQIWVQGRLGRRHRSGTQPSLHTEDFEHASALYIYRASTRQQRNGRGPQQCASGCGASRASSTGSCARATSRTRRPGRPSRGTWPLSAVAPQTTPAVGKSSLMTLRYSAFLLLCLCQLTRGLAYMCCQQGWHQKAHAKETGMALCSTPPWVL